jgi:predicted O-methyltransferase YrrM
VKTITEQLAKALGQPIAVEVSDSKQDYSMFNDGGVECETGEFLYAFMRILKPKLVLETGTHKGIGAAYMGFGLKHNGFGELHTYEFLENHYQDTKQLLKGLGLDDSVRIHKMDVAALVPQEKFDFIFLDTEPQTRFAELIQFFPALNPGGYVFIHDLHRHMHQIPNEEHGFAWPYGKLPPEIIKLVKEDKLRPFHFPTPRGLTGFYKTREDDYKWN